MVNRSEVPPISIPCTYGHLPMRKRNTNILWIEYNIFTFEFYFLKWKQGVKNGIIMPRWVERTLLCKNYNGMASTLMFVTCSLIDIKWICQLGLFKLDFIYTHETHYFKNFHKQVDFCYNFYRTSSPVHDVKNAATKDMKCLSLI